MNLRRRSYLAEAVYKRDRFYRDLAEEFYEALVKWVKKHKDQLQKRKGGELYVAANKFWKHPDARRLVVLFTPGGKGIHGGVGTAQTQLGKTNVLTLASLKGPWNTKYLDTRISKETVIHELIHVLDPGLHKGGTSLAVAQADTGKYYNNPSEWNAYWQQGAHSLEKTVEALHGSKMDPRLIRVRLGDGSLPQLRARADMYWEKAFLKAMNRKTTRKFEKRFAQLWQSFKERGLL